MNRRIATNGDGRFLITDLNPGSYILQFRKTGYRVSQYALRMIAQIDRDVTIKLRPIDASDSFTPEVAVQVALETNRRIGFRGAQSMVVGREDLERWDTAPLGIALNGTFAGNIIREVPAACILVNGYEPLSTVIGGSGFAGLGSRRNAPTSINAAGTMRTQSVDRARAAAGPVDGSTSSGPTKWSSWSSTRPAARTRARCAIASRRVRAAPARQIQPAL